MESILWYNNSVIWPLMPGLFEIMVDKVSPWFVPPFTNPRFQIKVPWFLDVAKTLFLKLIHKK